MAMNNNFSFGKYNPIASPIHRLNAQFKFIMMIAIVIMIFFNTGGSGYVIMSVLTFSTYFMAKLKAKTLVNLLKPLIFMGVILLLINWFSIKGSITLDVFENGVKHQEVVQPWGAGEWWALSPYALYQTIFILYRIYLMIIWTSILTSTTSPIELTLALETLMTPAKWFKIPVHEIAMMIAIALRFIPTLIEESHRIMKAQASRGVDFENGHFNEKSKSLVSLIIPLFISSFQKAEDLANAMEARGYDPKARRTRYRQFQYRFTDWSALIFITLLFTFFVLWIALPFLNQNIYFKYLDFFKIIDPSSTIK